MMLIVLSLLLPSCGGGARQRVAVEGVESVARLGWSGFEAVLTVRNAEYVEAARALGK